MDGTEAIWWKTPSARGKLLPAHVSPTIVYVRSPHCHLDDEDAHAWHVRARIGTGTRFKIKEWIGACQGSYRHGGSPRRNSSERRKTSTPTSRQTNRYWTASTSFPTRRQVFPRRQRLVGTLGKERCQHSHHRGYLWTGPSSI